MSGLALELTDVTVRYRAGRPAFPADVCALDGVSLALGPGESAGVVGGAGAGKTTLLLCAAGILSADSGTVRSTRAEFVSRTGGAHLALSVRASLEFAASLLDAAGCDAEPDVAGVLRRTDLAHVADVRLFQLGAGSRARAGIAHALLGEPRVLCVDDPLSLLDAAERRRYTALLEQLRAEGIAVLLSARDASLLEGATTRVVELRAGRLHVAAPGASTLELDVALPRHAAAVLSDRVPAVRRRGRALRVSLDRISAEEVLSTCVALGISVYGSRVITTAVSGKVAEGGE